MAPVLLHGRVVWDQNLFPRDECEERLRLVQAAAAGRGLDGLLVGGARLDYANLVYLTQFVPYAAWALAIVPAEGAEMTLVTGVGGGRELPASRARTWVGDVRNLPNLGPALVDLLRERGLQAGQTSRLGLVGLGTLPVGLEQRLRAGLAEAFACVDADDVLAELRAGLRSRELSAVRRAAEIAHAARAEVERAHAAGASNAAALVAGERVARTLGALDVRGLVSLDDDDPALAPVEGPSEYRGEPLVGYLAVNSLGYWAEVAITAGPTDPEEMQLARAALAELRSQARPGARAGDLAAAAERVLLAQAARPAAAAEASHAAESVFRKRFQLVEQDLGFGHGIGLGLAAAPEIVTDNPEPLVQDALLALRVRLPRAFVSDLVRVTPGGGVSVWP
jgi:Xaa-Pro aminopeptidase